MNTSKTYLMMSITVLMLLSPLIANLQHAQAETGVAFNIHIFCNSSTYISNQENK